MISMLGSLQRNLWVGWLLRLAVAATALAILSTQVDFTCVLNTLTMMDGRMILPILGLYLAIRQIWAYQMSLGLTPLRIHFTVPHLFKIVLVSSFYALVLPENVVAGGAASWYKLSRRNGRRIEIGALLVYLRAVNTLTLLAVGFAGLWFDSHLISPQFRAVIGGIFLGVVLGSLPFLSPGIASLMERVGKPYLHRLSLPHWVQDKGREAWMALAVFRTLRRRTVVLMFGLSMASHLLGVALYHLLALALGIRLPVFVIGWIRSLLSIIQMVPVSLAGLGVRDVSLVILLQNYGVAETHALSLSLAVLSVMIVGATLGGVLELHDVLWERRGARRSVSAQKVGTAMKQGNQV